MRDNCKPSKISFKSSSRTNPEKRDAFLPHYRIKLVQIPSRPLLILASAILSGHHYNANRHK